MRKPAGVLIAPPLSSIRHGKRVGYDIDLSALQFLQGSATRLQQILRHIQSVALQIVKNKNRDLLWTVSKRSPEFKITSPEHRM